MNTAPENLKTTRTEVSAARRRIRWWIAMLILALVAANLVRVRLSSDLEGNFKNMQTFMTIGVGVLLLILWLMLLSGLRWLTRFATLGAFNDQEAVCYKLSLRPH